jgi:aminoglycoside phosphotransferase (APT) family kinase protein
LLARVHDLSLGFSPPTDAIWGESAPDPGPIEVIAHRDWTPYNAVFRDGRLVAVVDWDLARPGSRLADLAWAAFMWVPLVPDQAALDSGWALPLDRVARLRRFCDAYGLAERARIVDAVDTRIAGHVRWVSEQAEAGHRAYAAMVADGALDFYRTCLDYLRAEAESWRLALEHDE